ncbi:hypothetical protein [Baekduia sp. Peel2402]|uniref:hypothetical protein n=1 Tax=Baekduia sp. Peel2402 TaxID=3458296 RepID=UPI00403ECF73
MGRSDVEIRIRGRLDDDGVRRLQEAFGTLDVSETTLTGEIADQAQLQSALALLRELGCEVVEVRRVSGR